MEKITRKIITEVDNYIHDDLIKESEKFKKAFKNSVYGDLENKEVIKSKIYNIIKKENLITSKNINKIIRFNDKNLLQLEDKFEIILYIFFKSFSKKAFDNLISKYKLDNIRDKGEKRYYYIDKKDIEYIYENENIQLSHEDKLKIIVQKIYSLYKGLGKIDFISQMEIDGISGGVGGYENQNIWLFYKGKNIHLEFLKLEKNELKMICHKIYKYESKGQLSKKDGYKIGRMKDGSRIVVARPDFAESYMFFIRKFKTKKVKLSKIVGDKKVEKLLKFLVKGSSNLVITGEQGVGKTTMLLALIEYIYDIYTIRIFESDFELNCRKRFKDKNICTFQKTENILGEEAIDFMKKTDGMVSIVGEVSNDNVASHIIQTSQVASKFTLFTHHAKTFDYLISALRNSLLNTSMFQNEKIAKNQVLDVIDFNIHLEKDFYGKRYIKRITESFKNEDGNYVNKNIYIYEKGKYKYINKISEKRIKKMLNEMNNEDREKFKKEFSK